jgi:Holliday junction DNA helicase RuvA
VDADLIAALTALGYSVAEAQEAIGALPREELPLEERVRLALAYFAT